MTRASWGEEEEDTVTIADNYTALDAIGLGALQCSIAEAGRVKLRA